MFVLALPILSQLPLLRDSIEIQARPGMLEAMRELLLALLQRAISSGGEGRRAAETSLAKVVRMMERWRPPSLLVDAVCFKRL